MRSCPLLRLLKSPPRRHSTDEASLCGDRRTPTKRLTLTLTRCDSRHARAEDAAHPPPPEPSLVPCRCDQQPMDPCGVRHEPKRVHLEGGRAGLHISLERCPSSCSFPSYSCMVVCKNFLPSPLEDAYNGHTDDERLLSTLLQGNHSNV